MDNLRLAIINHIEDLKTELEQEKILTLQLEALLGYDSVMTYHDGKQDIIQREINTLLGLLEETA